MHSMERKLRQETHLRSRQRRHRPQGYSGRACRVVGEGRAHRSRGRSDRTAQPTRVGRGAAARDVTNASERPSPLLADARHRPLQAIQRRVRPPSRRCAPASGHQLAYSDTRQRLIARYGGEEFAVLLPNAEPNDAVASIVERLREAVPAGQTCSAGLVLWDESEPPEAFVARADAALYEAKRAGRNRVISGV